MKRNIVFFGSVVIAVTALLLTANHSINTQPVSAQKSDPAKTVTTQSPRSNRIKSIIKGSEEPDQIPDMVAYELFLRTVAEGNARSLVQLADLNEDQTEAVMMNARSLQEDFLEPNDKKAHELKAATDNLSKVQIDSGLEKLQKKKDEAVARVVDSFLPGTLREEGMAKLNKFLNDSVKRDIQKIVLKGAERSAKPSFNSRYAKSFNSGNRFEGGGSLYLYSAAWQVGMNVYGSGSLSEQYSSQTSYKITTTVTSPSGRSNTTQSDWGYATVVHDAGLSVGVEDGTYLVEANYEEESGYYDEFGNFTGNGSFYVGDSSSSMLVAPTVNLTIAQVTPNQFILSGNPPGGQGSGVVTAMLSSTESVPAGTTIEYDFYETANPGVQYTVTPGASTGFPGNFPPGTNRRIRREISNPGELETLTALFSISLTPTSDTTGSVTNRLRINRIITSSGNNGGIQGENNEVPAVFTLSIAPPTPTPTPTPAPSPGPTVPPLPPPGSTTTCYASSPGGGINMCSPGYFMSGPYCCQYSSPLLLDIEGDGFEMTDYYYGVPFDVNGDGIANQTSWTAQNTDDAWLVLDRNGNGLIDNGQEMFGDASEQPVSQNPRNGFASLAVFDTAAKGGNGDGKITRRDRIFRKLRLWQDKNHNGISEPEELSRLPALDVVAVFLDYQESRRTDQHGNRFKYKARVRDAAGANVGRWAWDVFLLIAPPGQTSNLSCPARDSLSSAFSVKKITFPSLDLIQSP